MVGLARTIYSPKPGELAGQLRDPKELCDLADRDAVESHLFDAFIPAAYNAGPSCRWEAGQAESWLVFLACHLQYKIESPDYAWWELKRDLRPFKDVNPDPSNGIGFGVTEAVTTIWRTVLLSLYAVAFNIVFVLLGDVIGSAMGNRHDIPEDLIKLSEGFAWYFLAILVLVGLWTGLQGVPTNLALAASPRGVLTRDRRAALTVWLACGLGFGLIAEAVTFLKFVHGRPWIWVASGFLFGFAFGVTVSSRKMAWPLYTLGRGRLARRRRLPWSLMSFLDDAHHRGVLRQAGAIYQFRHIELQHRLATRVTDTDSLVGQSDRSRARQ
jgi:hypothetical protein